MSESLEKGMRDVLLADSGVVALVANRIRPHKLAEEDDLPAIIIEVPDDSPVEDLSDDDPSAGQATIDVVCIAYQRADARTLAEAARTALAGYRGDAGDLMFDPCTLRQTQSEHEPADDAGDDGDWYLEVLSFDVWYRR